MGKLPAEKFSHRVLYAMVGVSAAVFAAFYMVGYDTPSPLPGVSAAPLLTGAVVWLCCIAAVAGAAVAVWSAARGVKNSWTDTGHNVPAGKIAAGTAAATALVMALSFAFAGSGSVVVNGAEFTDGFWLTAAGGMVSACISMLAIAAAAAIYGATRYWRGKR